MIFQGKMAMVTGGGGYIGGVLCRELAGQGLRVANDPLVGQTLAALTGVDIPQVARNFSSTVDNVIWDQIGFEEEEIRRNPQATRDPLIIGVFGAAQAF